MILDQHTKPARIRSCLVVIGLLDIALDAVLPPNRLPGHTLVSRGPDDHACVPTRSGPGALSEWRSLHDSYRLDSDRTDQRQPASCRTSFGGWTSS